MLSFALAVQPLSHPATQSERSGNPDASGPTGVIVESVTPDSAAAKAGIKVGDRLLTYDGKPLLSPSMLAALQANTFGKPTMELRLRRGEETLTLSVPVSPLGMSMRPDLPGAAQNLYEDGRAIPSRDGDGAAQVVAKWQAAARARFLHFACHGILDDRMPLASGLALSTTDEATRGHADAGTTATTSHPANQPTKDDGLLQAWEIIEKVRLNADLVVLSACETGLGTTTRHEGVVGLTRALQYAGAKSIVVSLWSVSDDSTAALMTAFYTELKKGTPKDVALQRATAAVRKNPKWSHPFYWAPFTLHGEWR